MMFIHIQSRAGLIHLSARVCLFVQCVRCTCDGKCLLPVDCNKVVNQVSTLGVAFGDRGG